MSLGFIGAPPSKTAVAFADLCSSPEEELSREKALQTVVQGQQAENLLDFDAEEPSSASSNRDEDFLAGVGSSGISQQAIATAAKSSNPLDELMDLFSSASMTTPSAPVGMPQAANGPGGHGGMVGLEDLMSPPSGSPVPQQTPATQQPKPQQEDDLLGLL